MRGYPLAVPICSRISKPLPLLMLGLALVLVAAACDTSGSDSTTTVAQTSSTGTQAPTTTTTLLTSIPSGSIPGETSASIDPDVAEAIRVQIGVLMLDAEESRGLPFLEVPTVTILDNADFTVRVREALEEDVDPEEIAGSQAMFELLGMLNGTLDLYEFLIDLYTEQVAGFYDPDARELVIPASADGMTPFQEMTIVHELIHALTDQHFEFDEEYDARIEAAMGDDAAGLLALVEGDATYQQFLFLESMDPQDAAQVVLESLSFDTTVLDSAPLWIQQDLAFPYEQGFPFVGYLVNEDGLKGVDGAYLRFPISTEQILHPEKYVRNELPSDLAQLNVTLDGWEMIHEATFGEWGIRLLLLDSLRPGELVQASAGWGNDRYRTFINGDDTAFAWVYSGETIKDAEDLADGLIAHIRRTMSAGTSVESGGGLLFEGGETYVFIDRVDDKIFMVASTDVAAGESLREQLGV